MSSFSRPISRTQLCHPHLCWQPWTAYTLQPGSEPRAVDGLGCWEHGLYSCPWGLRYSRCVSKRLESKERSGTPNVTQVKERKQNGNLKKAGRCPVCANHPWDKRPIPLGQEKRKPSVYRGWELKWFMSIVKKNKTKQQQQKLGSCFAWGSAKSDLSSKL